MAIDLVRENYLKQQEIAELKMDIAVLVAVVKVYLTEREAGQPVPLLPELVTVTMVEDIVDKWNFEKSHEPTGSSK